MLIAPSENLLETIHRVVIEIEGTAGYMSRGMVRGSIEWALTYVYGFEPFPDVITKAAALIYAIIVFHPFVDGNKRTALLGAYHFLWYNGYMFRIPEDSVEFTIKIAEFKREVPEIAEWVNKNSKRSLKARWTNLMLTISLTILPHNLYLALLFLFLCSEAPLPRYLARAR